MNDNCWYKTVCTEECVDNCVRYVEMRNLIQNSGIPKAKQLPQTLEAGVDYEAFCELADIKDDIVTFVNDGSNLYIASRETGNGKTTWAIKLLLKYFDEIWAGNGLRVRGMFVHVPTLLLQLKDFNSPLPKEYLENLANCDLVVWDDIASTELSKYDYSQLLMYVDGRIMNGKANIFTGNFPNRDGLERALGNRLTSRVWNSSKVVEFKGKDRR